MLAWLCLDSITVFLSNVFSILWLLLTLLLLAESQLETALLLCSVRLLIWHPPWSLYLRSKPVVEVELPRAATSDAIRCNQST